MSEQSGSAEEQVCAFFKPKVRRGATMRRRQASSDESGDEGTVTRVERKRHNGLVQGTGGSSSSSTSKKWRLEAENKDEDRTVGVAFKSSTSKRAGSGDQRATATIEIDTEIDKDARSIFERAQKINEEQKDKLDDKVYRGINNYTQYISKKDTAAGSAAKTKAKGPLRAPTNVRSTVRWDYQPDVCKDFKETGFCGFGDSCIFMHDRSDYKHGWQLDREWEAKEKTKRLQGDADSDDKEDNDRKYEIPSDEEDLPFACFICREEFVNPVVTKCEHFFCEKCALANFKKTSHCYVCGKPTGGVFNPAKELASKLAEKKRAEQSDSGGDHQDASVGQEDHHKKQKDGPGDKPREDSDSSD